MIKLPVYIQEAAEQDGSYSIHDCNGELLADLLTRQTAQTLARRLNDVEIIRVFVRGGNIEDVEGVPAGVVVEVVDFDNDGEHFDGQKCSIGRYGATASLAELDINGKMRTRAEIEELDQQGQV